MTSLPENQQPTQPLTFDATDTNISEALAATFDGMIAEIQTPSGCHIDLFDCTASMSLAGTRTAPPMLQISIMIEGSGQSWMEDGIPPVSFAANSCSLLYSEKPITGGFNIEKDTRITLVDLRYSPQYMEEFQPTILKMMRQPAFKTCLDGEEGIWWVQFPTPPELQKIALEMLASDTTSAGQKFLLEAKSVEVLSHVTRMLEQHLPDGASHTAGLSTRDTRNIRTARDLLSSKPDHDWTIRELAKAVGLNDNKLKKGFRSLFGTTVYGFLQQIRMELAARRLLSDADSITDIAASVGYSSPAHFARIFRRYFKVSPRDYRNSQP